MGYESAPATKLLATHCAVCVRPLVDAVSVNVGMGPDCRKKYYNETEGDAANRPEANKLVYFIAAKKGASAEVAAAISKISALGFTKLADVLTDRIAKVRITVEGDKLLLKAPYSETAVPILAKVPGRRWDKERKVNTYPSSSRGALWDALKRAFPDALAHGPSGFFIVGGPSIPKLELRPVAAAGATEKAKPSPEPVHKTRGTPLPPAVDLVAAMKADEEARLAAERRKIEAEDREMKRLEAEADRAQTEREERAKAEAKAKLESGKPTQMSLEEVRRKFTQNLVA